MKRFNPRRSAGFTLIELLAGMTILAIIVLFLNKIFADSTTLWRMGNKKIEAMSDGRAAIEYMTRLLSGAIVDKTFSLRLYTDVDSVPGSVQSDRLYFVTLQSKPDADGERQAREIAFRVGLMKDAYGNDMTNRWRVLMWEAFQDGDAYYTCYKTNTWFEIPNKAKVGGPVLAENVRTLEFYVYDSAGVAHSDYDSNTLGTPSAVEIYLEMLGDEDATRAELLSGQAQQDYVNQNTKRFVGRANFNNGLGYAKAF